MDKALLHIDRLSVRFQQGTQRVEAVKSISLSLARGEMLALVGESGSGKSVTAQAVMGLLPDSAQQTGDIVFAGEPLTRRQVAGIRGKRIGMVFQEPLSALNPLHRIGRQIGEMLSVHQRLSAAEQKARIGLLLEQVGLPHFKDRLDAYPHQLSGGERQRVMIAMAIANDPELLIADEPTTALDVTLQAQILDLLKTLQRERGMAILLITHDLTIVRRLAEKVAIMRHGELVEQGETRAVFTAPRHDYTRMLLDSEPKGSAPALPDSAPQRLRAEGLKVYFPIKRGILGRTKDYVKAVDRVSLTLQRGETLGIVGESGSGKSTLAMALLRLIPSEGPIVWLSEQGPVDLQTRSGSGLRGLRYQMQPVFQDPYGSLNPRMTVGELVAEGLRLHRPSLRAEEREAAVATMLGEVGLQPEMIHRFPHEFSGGQRQRIAIARAMILRPALLVLDEPTSALDLTVQSQIVELLKRFQREQQLSYLFISHDLRVVRALAHRIMVMRRGEVVEEGETEALIRHPQQDYTKRLVEAAFTKELKEENSHE